MLSFVISDPFAVMNTIGLVAFALVGASKAIREEFDVFGIAIVGLAMAFAGGVTRDLLVTRVPLALQSPPKLRWGSSAFSWRSRYGLVWNHRRSTR